ncbi:MAG: hypothetical protein JWS10_95 [Cypionkella sp.]|uniref:hypothetical protein n=1 Tax=Cypionkella sp. TaxID=2811411 RepID=UPI0026223598|nr:hypothetical protein [Cypionkella sp.]MDB5657480.1 hypothetical protein [Cypionkella sp.]
MRYILPFLLLATPAGAADLATGDAIRSALVGNTVTGSMSASGAYAEFYAPDGSLHAADYTGKWAVKGDKMCFAYGQDPENCWSVVIDGAHVVWMSEAGEEGHGSIKPGNPGGW